MNKITILLWGLDVLNAPGFECLDTDFPINTLFWGLLWGWEVLDFAIAWIRTYVSILEENKEC